MVWTRLLAVKIVVLQIGKGEAQRQPCNGRVGPTTGSLGGSG
jgi:hypothetical protein